MLSRPNSNIKKYLLLLCGFTLTFFFNCLRIWATIFGQSVFVLQDVSTPRFSLKKNPQSSLLLSIRWFFLGVHMLGLGDCQKNLRELPICFFLFLENILISLKKNKCWWWACLTCCTLSTFVLLYLSFIDLWERALWVAVWVKVAQVYFSEMGSGLKIGPPPSLLCHTD